MRLGQTQIVSVIIIVGIALSTVSTVLPWASNMIQKRKDAKSLEDVYNFFQTLDTSIRDISKSGGEESLTLKVPGRFTVYPESFTSPLNNNSIVFFFQGKVSNVAEGNWIPLNTPNTNDIATLGIDTPSVIFGKAEKAGNILNIQYKLWYRELDDPSGKHGYKIVLNTTSDAEESTATGFIRIQRLGSRSLTVGSKTLTVTEINIII